MDYAGLSSSVKDLVDHRAESILGHLAKNNTFALDAEQRNAWLEQIRVVRSQLAGLDGWVAFEFFIPRMGKRADLVVTTAGIIFVVEFKVGAREFDAAALDQVVDYALDLKNLHAGSHDRPLVPLVPSAGLVK